MSAPPEGPDRGPAPDPYAEWDAAYVLGALSPAERSEFEEHQAACRRCRSAVAELEGLPGLLAQVGPEDAAVLAGEPEEPSRSPVTQVQPASPAPREPRRLTRALLGTAAALLLVLAGLGLGQVLPSRDARAPEQLAFAALEPSNITANVRLVPVQGGTQVEVECQYSGASSPYPGAPASRYSVVVVDRAGHPSRIKDWDVKPDKVMRPTATTSLDVRQIRDVEIWETATDAPVLRATRS